MEEKMQRITRRQFNGMLLAGAAATLPLPARAQGAGKLTLYLGPPEKTCSALWSPRKTGT